MIIMLNKSELIWPDFHNFLKLVSFLCLLYMIIILILYTIMYISTKTE